MFNFKMYLFLNYYLFTTLCIKNLHWKWIPGYWPVLQKQEVINIKFQICIFKYFLCFLLIFGDSMLQFSVTLHLLNIPSIYSCTVGWSISKPYCFEVNLLIIPFFFSLTVWSIVCYQSAWTLCIVFEKKKHELQDFFI